MAKCTLFSNSVEKVAAQVVHSGTHPNDLHFRADFTLVPHVCALEIVQMLCSLVHIHTCHSNAGFSGWFYSHFLYPGQLYHILSGVPTPRFRLRISGSRREDEGINSTMSPRMEV